MEMQKFIITSKVQNKKWFDLEPIIAVKNILGKLPRLIPKD